MLHLDIGEESEPYGLFVFAINADQTREKHIATKLLLLIMVENEDA
jgi:hypothetical protein